MRFFSSVLAATLLCWLSAGGGVSMAQQMTITHVRIIDGTGKPPLEDQMVVIGNGKILSVHAARQGEKFPSGEVVDGSGKTLIPGLINAHGHLALVDGTKNSADYYTEPHVLAELRQYESYGVLDMLSLGLNRDLIYGIRARQKQGELDGATVFVADRGIGVNGGAPPIVHQPDQLYQPQTPDEARADVRAAAGRNTDFIKIWVDNLYGAKPKMDPAVYQAVIDEAHKHHIKVAAHVYALADARQLVADGVDVLAHSVRDSALDPQLLSAMQAHGVYYIPTFTVDESFFVYADHPEMLKDPFFEKAVPADLLAMLSSEAYRQKVAGDPLTERHRQDFANAQKNLMLAFDAGVKVAFGTDSGAMPTRVPGFAEHRELELMVAAGLTPLEAIHCATETNAELLGIAGRTGTIEPGKRADLILLNGNPAEDIRNTRKIAAIWHDGRSVTPALAK